MKRREAYKLDELLLKICGYFTSKRIDTASGVAREVNVNPRTAQKYLNMGVNLGIFLSDELYKTRDGRCCVGYWLNPKYLEIFNEIKEMKPCRENTPS